MKTGLLVLGYLLLAPIAGCLLAGIDRILTARFQSRVGPPLLQPLYDVLKLWGKKKIVVTDMQNFYVLCFFIFTVAAGALFFAGGDLLLVIFTLTVGAVFFILGAYSVNSPYSTIGAERELLQMFAYEPMLLIAAMGMYMITKSFHVDDIVNYHGPLVKYLPGIFFGFLYIITIKLRKSPFDLSASHHAHQELVRGITTEFSGPSLALVEIAHWYENIMLLGFVYLFFAWNPVIGIAAVIITYAFEVLLDNAYARLTWQFTVKWSWIVAIVFGVVNIGAVYFLVK